MAGWNLHLCHSHYPRGALHLVLEKIDMDMGHIISSAYPFPLRLDDYHARTHPEMYWFHFKIDSCSFPSMLGEFDLRRVGGRGRDHS